MSEFNDESEKSGYKCPYCGVHHYCDDWGYDYDGEEMQCNECDKKFYATASHTIDFVSTPDCALNGETHNPVFFGGKINAYFCDVCDKCLGETL